VKRVVTYLKEPEHRALCKLADRELRDPRAQAALIIQRELERVRLLPANCTDVGGKAHSQPLEASNACLAGLVHAGIRLFSLFSATIDPALLFLAVISQTILPDYLTAYDMYILPALLLICMVGWSLLLSLIQQAVEQAVEEAAYEAARALVGEALGSAPRRSEPARRTAIRPTGGQRAASLTQKAGPERSRRAGSERSRRERRSSGNRRAGCGGKANLGSGRSSL